MKSEFTASSRAQWRSWLKENHDHVPEIWLVYYKKHTGMPSISYAESVEEAICFGWIDGLIKKIDDQRYTHRFTPRRQGSKWSLRNIKIAQKMIDNGQMTRSGFDAFNQRKLYEGVVLEARKNQAYHLSPDLEIILKAHTVAWRNFMALTPSEKKKYVCWLQSAKRQGTREKRLSEVIKLLMNNRKLGMK